MVSTLLHAPSLTLQPKSDVSDFGRSIKWPNSGKPEFGCKRGRGRTKPAAVLSHQARCSRSDPPLTRDVDGQEFDAGLLNWLRIEFHQHQHLLWHTHFDRKPQRGRFACSERVIMGPVAARKLPRKSLRGRRLHPWRQ